MNDHSEGVVTEAVVVRRCRVSNPGGTLQQWLTQTRPGGVHVIDVHRVRHGVPEGGSVVVDCPVRSAQGIHMTQGAWPSVVEQEALDLGEADYFIGCTFWNSETLGTDPADGCRCSQCSAMAEGMRLAGEPRFVPVPGGLDPRDPPLDAATPPPHPDTGDGIGQWRSDVRPGAADTGDAPAAARPAEPDGGDHADA